MQRVTAVTHGRHTWPRRSARRSLPQEGTAARRGRAWAGRRVRRVCAGAPHAGATRRQRRRSRSREHTQWSARRAPARTADAPRAACRVADGGDGCGLSAAGGELAARGDGCELSAAGRGLAARDDGGEGECGASAGAAGDGRATCVWLGRLWRREGEKRCGGGGGAASTHIASGVTALSQIGARWRCLLYRDRQADGMTGCGRPQQASRHELLLSYVCEASLRAEGEHGERVRRPAGSPAEPALWPRRKLTISDPARARPSCWAGCGAGAWRGAWRAVRCKCGARRGCACVCGAARCACVRRGAGVRGAVAGALVCMRASGRAGDALTFTTRTGPRGGWPSRLRPCR